MNDKRFREKNYYKKKITELVEKIENPAILNYIYIIVSDVVKEDKTNEQKN